MVNSLVSAHRDKIISIARRNGAHNIRIYGSYARGEEHPGSDLDLLGDIDPEKSLLDQAPESRILKQCFGYKLVLSNLNAFMGSSKKKYVPMLYPCER